MFLHALPRKEARPSDVNDAEKQSPTATAPAPATAAVENDSAEAAAEEEVGGHVIHQSEPTSAVRV